MKMYKTQTFSNNGMQISGLGSFNPTSACMFYG